MAQFRSLKDLQATIIEALAILPRDLDLIVGVPRSGLLPATLLALNLNIPMTDVEGLLNGRVIAAGKRITSKYPNDQLFENAKKILVIDDSVATGNEMRNVRKRIAEAKLPYEVLYAAVYVTPEGMPLVDYAFEELKLGRSFAWNVMHRPNLVHFCVDMDGILCVDPKPIENDDGKRYEHFLYNTKPLFIPSYEIGWIVTGRLSKYRKLTESWLHRHGVRYRELLMLDLPDAETRRAIGIAPFKAKSYIETGASMFIESSTHQARQIAEISGRPVLCLPEQKLILPGIEDRLPEMFWKAPRSILRRFKSMKIRMNHRKLNRKFMNDNYPN